jgi:hypothetical protein
MRRQCLDDHRPTNSPWQALRTHLLVLLLSHLGKRYTPRHLLLPLTLQMEITTPRVTTGLQPRNHRNHLILIMVPIRCQQHPSLNLPITKIRIPSRVDRNVLQVIQWLRHLYPRNRPSRRVDLVYKDIPH